MIEITKEFTGVLISDVNARKAFDVVNIVQNKLKLPIILASSRDYRFQLPLIYGKRIERLRFDNISNFEEDLDRISSNYSGRLVYLPVSELATRFYIQLREQNKLSSEWHDVLPTLHLFNLTSDKWLFQQFCEERNHPVPRSITVDNFKELQHNFRPVVLKPKYGQGSVGIKYYDRLVDLPDPDVIDWKENLIQEKVISNGKVAGAFFLRYKGRILSEYCHQRIRTFPPEGGVTVFSQSVEYPEILELGRAVLHDLDWQGVAMIEFMFDEPSKSWKIIELNPRLWGSVLLSAFNESQLLNVYVVASLNLLKDNWVIPSVKSVFIRWLFPFEILSFLKGSLSIRQLLCFNFKNTCYINFTYSSALRSFLFLLYFTVNLGSINRFIKKIMK